MNTQDIIKKYRTKIILKQDPEALRVYETLYKAIDTKLKESEDKVSKTLNDLVQTMGDTLKKMTDYVQSLRPLQGIPGENYNLTEFDKLEIASQIKVPVIEKIIEKTEIIKEQPIVHETVKEIVNNIENKDTPDQIVDKVNNAQKKILMKSIEDLQKKLDDIEIRVRESKRGGGGKSGGGMGNTQHESKLVQSSTTAVLTSYPISGNGYALWVYYQGQAVARGVGYTVSNDKKTINLLFTPVDDTYVDLIYIR